MLTDYKNYVNLKWKCNFLTCKHLRIALLFKGAVMLSNVHMYKLYNFNKYKNSCELDSQLFFWLLFSNIGIL